LFSESQDVEDFASHSIELQHVLHNILPEAIDSPLVKALENHGLMTVQDVLLLNQAERDALQFAKADGSPSTFPIGSKNKLLAIKLIGQHCEDAGKPIANLQSLITTYILQQPNFGRITSIKAHLPWNIRIHSKCAFPSGLKWAFPW